MELILVVNGGSSSQKCALFQKEPLDLLWKGQIRWKKEQQDFTVVWKGKKEEKKLDLKNVEEAFKYLFNDLKNRHISLTSMAIGHRIVHGGELFKVPTLLDETVEKELEQVSELAPIHSKINLLGYTLARDFFPHSQHYGVFDTAFHATLKEEVYTYPVPYEWREKGIRRYGFHGISFSYCSKQIKKFLNDQDKKVILCHLGSGSSICALYQGKSVDTTMGLTPLEGLMMGTRSGTIDPGLIFHMERKEKMAREELDRVLNQESGLKGISGISGDIREIREVASTNKRAELALKMFDYRLKIFVGMMIASIEGIDVLAFTGGIGENDSNVRLSLCQSLRFLGLELDEKANAEKNSEIRLISSPSSTVKIIVIPTDEEREIVEQIKKFK